MTLEGTRRQGTITGWKRSYGFATSMVGETPIDVFVHRRNFATHGGRVNIKDRGMEIGDNIVFSIKRPRAPDKSNYEAANASRLPSDIAAERGPSQPRPTRHKNISTIRTAQQRICTGGA